MTETLYGPWSVEVTSVSAGFSERFVIKGSAGNDDAYPATPGLRLDVTGDAWTLQLEWNNNAGSGWQASHVQRSAEYTILDGLTVTLGADDNINEVRDFDYDDVILTCRSLDQEISPPLKDPPIVFTITKGELNGD